MIESISKNAKYTCDAGITGRPGIGNHQELKGRQKQQDASNRSMQATAVTPVTARMTAIA
jgi:hypothetical protein